MDRLRNEIIKIWFDVESVVKKTVDGQLKWFEQMCRMNENTLHLKKSTSILD